MPPLKHLSHPPTTLVHTPALLTQVTVPAILPPPSLPNSFPHDIQYLEQRRKPIGVSELPFPATPAHTLHGSPVPGQVQTLTPAFWLVRPGPGKSLVMSAPSTPTPPTTVFQHQIGLGSNPLFRTG